jgi:hypothetical protein
MRNPDESTFDAKNKRPSVVRGVLIICVLCLGAVVLPIIAGMILHKEGYGSIARKFSSAMQNGDAATAKNIIDPSDWDRINEITSKHIAIDCPPKINGHQNIYSVTAEWGSESMATYHYWWLCQSEGYVFSADIELLQSDGVWEISDWNICESSSGECD